MYFQQDNFNYQIVCCKAKPRDIVIRGVHLNHSTNIFAVRFSLSLLTTK